MKIAALDRGFVALFVSLAFLGATSTMRSQPRNDTNVVIPVIQFQDVPLPKAIENLGRQARLNFILDPKVARTSRGADGKFVAVAAVTIQWENMTARQALMTLLKEHNLFLVESPVSSVSRIIVTSQIAKPVDADWVRSGTNAVVPLMQFVEAPLSVAVTHIAEKGKLNIVIAPELSMPSFVPGKPFVPEPTVSFRWENLTARQAIAALCENYDLVMVKDPATGTLRISPKATDDAKSNVLEKEKVKGPGTR